MHSINQSDSKDIYNVTKDFKINAVQKLSVLQSMLKKYRGFHKHIKQHICFQH